MGVQNSQEKQLIESKLKRQQRLEDDVFGWIEVFRGKEAPYDYVMKFSKTFYAQGPQYAQYLKHLKNFQKLQHKILPKMHFISQEQQINCLQAPTICCYINYYNFTLKKAIERRFQAKSNFSEADLWFLTLSLIGLGQYLKQNGIALSEYSTDKIYLSPDGVPKVYILHASPDNRHNSYYEVLSDDQKFTKYLLSPQQLYYLTKDQYQVKFDMYKSDIFVIGLIILEMATLKSSLKYFNRHTKTIGMHKIKEDISYLSKTYSHEFTNFLAKILTENPNDRPNFSQARQLLQIISGKYDVVKESNSIRLTESNDIIQKRKKALEIRRQVLEEEESSQSIFNSGLTTHPTSTKSIDKFKDSSIRKISLFPLNVHRTSSRALSAKVRDATPLRKNQQKVSTLFKNSHLSVLEGPIRIPRRRFQ